MSKALQLKSPITSKPLSDNFILDTLQTAIDKLSAKAFKGSVKNPQTEKVKIGYFKTLVYAISTYNAILKDTEIEELKAEIEEMRKLLTKAQKQ